MKNKTALAVLCAALGNIIWGVSFPLITIGSKLVPQTYIMLGHRFTLSTIVMLFMMLLGKKNKLSFKGKNWKPVVLLLLMQLSYYLFETYGILYTNSTISGLVLAVVPVVTIGTGALFLREYPTKRQALFCILPVAGVIIISIAGKSLKVSNLYLGGLFLLLTMLSSAIYKTVNRKATQEFSPFERTFLVLAASAIVFNVIGLKSNYAVEFGGWDGIHLSDIRELVLKNNMQALFIAVVGHVGVDEVDHLHLVELVDPDDSLGVRVFSHLSSEGGQVCGVIYGELLLLEDLVLEHVVVKSPL